MKHDKYATLKVWQGLAQQQLEQLNALSDGVPEGVFGMMTDLDGDGFHYWIVASSSKECPTGMEVLEIPAFEWLVSRALGPVPDALDTAFDAAYNRQMLPEGYDYDVYLPNIERYSAGDSRAADYRSEIWLPIAPSNITAQDRERVVQYLQNTLREKGYKGWKNVTGDFLGKI